MDRSSGFDPFIVTGLLRNGQQIGSRWRVTDIYDRNGRRIEFTYDDANRVIGETWYDTGSKVVNEITEEKVSGTYCRGRDA